MTCANASRCVSGRALTRNDDEILYMYIVQCNVHSFVMFVVAYAYADDVRCFLSLCGASLGNTVDSVGCNLVC